MSERDVTIRYRASRRDVRHRELHDMANPPRPDRPRGSERPLDRFRDDGQAGRRAPAELPPHQDARPAETSSRSPNSRPTARTTQSLPSDKGEIAYLHPQFVPRRNDRFDYLKPVDGSDPATDWGRCTRSNELPSVDQPAERLGAEHQQLAVSRGRTKQPRPEGLSRNTWTCSARTSAACTRCSCSTGSKGWTLDRLQAAAFDSYQPGFAELIPPLIKAYDALPKKDARRERLAGPIALLRGWNYRWGAGSVAAVDGNVLGRGPAKAARPPAARRARSTIYHAPGEATRAPRRSSQALARRCWRGYKQDFGWTGRCRGARSTASSASRRRSTIRSAMPRRAPGRLRLGQSRGSLASFSASPKPGTRKWYGTSGNSFVAVVEFGQRVRARAVTAGGESGNPASPHFNDQAERYATRQPARGLFLSGPTQGHTERRYKPGE